MEEHVFYQEIESILESIGCEVGVEIEGSEKLTDFFERYDTENLTMFIEIIEENYGILNIIVEMSINEVWEKLDEAGGN